MQKFGRLIGMSYELLNSQLTINRSSHRWVAFWTVKCIIPCNLLATFFSPCTIDIGLCITCITWHFRRNAVDEALPFEYCYEHGTLPSVCLSASTNGAPAAKFGLKIEFIPSKIHTENNCLKIDLMSACSKSDCTITTQPICKILTVLESPFYAERCSAHWSRKCDRNVRPVETSATVIYAHGCRLLGRRCYSIGDLFRSLCLSVVRLPRCVLWPNGARYAFSVYRSWIGMWERDFDWYNYRPPRFTLSPNGGRIEGSKLDIEIAALLLTCPSFQGSRLFN